MRGKERGSTSRQRRKGITPAHAGKSPAMSPGHITLRDHPRTCGEKQVPRMERPRSKGSPPHMRGKDCARLLAVSLKGITPAHAGKRAESDQTQKTQKDHPRTCGEKRLKVVILNAPVGSPPHMRGKGHLRCDLAGFGGDHPRTCGEKNRKPDSGTANWGSPPHMRGKDNANMLSFLSSRITPAHAGKSDSGTANWFNAKDHPRTCGEKTKKIP